jgi:hypothetical protein
MGLKAEGDGADLLKRSYGIDSAGGGAVGWASSLPVLCSYRPLRALTFANWEARWIGLER